MVHAVKFDWNIMDELDELEVFENLGTKLNSHKWKENTKSSRMLIEYVCTDCGFLASGSNKGPTVYTTVIILGQPPRGLAPRLVRSQLGNCPVGRYMGD